MPRKNSQALAERSALVALALAAGILNYSISGDKPPQTGEPRQIYAARQLLNDPRHPGNYTFYQDGAAVPGSREPFALAPVWPAILALPMRVFGEKPEALHLAMAPLTSLAVAASGLIAGALGAPAVPAACLAAISPLFAVHSSGLLPDLPALALALLALLCFLNTRYAAGAIAFITASLMGLSILALFPVLVIASIWKGHPRSAYIWLGAALAGSLAGPVARLIMVPGTPPFIGNLAGLAPKGAYVLATLAATIVHPGIWWVLLGVRLRRPGRFHPAPSGQVAAAAALSLILLVLLRAGGAWHNMHPLTLAFAPTGVNVPWFLGAGFAFAAWFMVLALESRGKDGAPTRFLLTWTASCVIGAVFSPVISARLVIGALPAVVILLALDMKRLLPPRLLRPTAGALVCGTLWLANGLVGADMRSARAPGDILKVAESALTKAGMRGVLTTDGGFQYQGMDRGFLLPARDPGAFAPGRALIITDVAPMHSKIPAGLEIRRWAVLYSEAPELPLRTVNPRSSAGFHGNGWLPYSFSTEPLEKVVIARVVGGGKGR